MTVRDIAVAFGFDVDRNSENEARNSIQGLKNLATRLLGSIAVVFGISGLKNFAQECVQAASDVEEMQNKFDVVFQGINEEVEEWAKNYADAVGRNRNTIKTYLADQQNLLVGFGMAREEGAKLAEEMTSLALDLASFANQDETVAVNAMTKAVMGESEAAKTLGAVLNDVTRAETMEAMGLSGKYESLTQLKKMQVNYNAILRQSPDAVGDCIRSMDSYEAAQRRQASAIAEFKELIGGQLLPFFTIYTNLLTKAINVATDFARAIFGDTQESNRLLRVSERIQALLKRLQPATERFTQSIKSGIDRATQTVRNIAEKLGGMENLFKLLAVAAAAFLISMNWATLVKGAKGFLDVLTGIGKLFGAVRLKTIAITTAITALLLIVEDFIHFLLGNDSLLGTIFDEAGIGADNAREKIIGAWNAARDALNAIWQTLKDAASRFFSGIAEYFEEHDVTERLRKTWESVSEDVVRIWTALTETADTVFSGISAFLEEHGASMVDIFETMGEAAGALIDVLLWLSSTILEVGFEVLADTVELACGAVEGLSDVLATAAGFLLEHKDALDLLIVAIGTVTALIAAYKVQQNALAIMTALLNGYLGIQNALMGAWAAVSGVAAGAASALGAAFTFLTSPIGLIILAIGALIAVGVLLYKHWDEVKAIAEQVWTAISEFFTGVWDAIKETFSAAVAVVQAVISEAWDAISEFISEAMETIRGVVEDVWNAISGTVSSILDAIFNVVSSAWERISSNISSVMGTISSTISSIWGNISASVSGKVDGIRQTIVDGFNAAKNFITGLASEALQWGADIINNIISGIKSTVGGITDAVSGVADTIRSFLHFSVPDTGPLVDTPNWMPDMMDTLTTGIESGGGNVLAAVQTLATGITDTMKSAMETADTDFRSGWGAVSGVIDETGPAILDRAGSVFSEARSAAVTAWNDLRRTTAEAWHGIEGTVASAAGAVRERAAEAFAGIRNGAASMLVSAGEGIANAWDSLRSATASAWRSIGETVSTVLTTAQTVAQSAIGSIRNTMASAWNALRSGAATAWDDINATVTTALANMQGSSSAAVSTLGSILSGAWNSIAAGIQTAASTIRTVLEAAWPAIQTVIGAIQDGIGTSIEAAWSGIQQTIFTTASAIQTVISDVFGAIQSFLGGNAAEAQAQLQNAWSAIQSVVTSVAETIQSTVSTVFTAVQSTIQQTIGTAQSFISSALGAIQSTFSGILSAILSNVSNTFSNMISSITSAMGNVKNAVVNGMQPAISYIKSLPAQALQWGADIVSNIADGIRNTISNVVNAVSDVASNIRSYLHFSVPDVGPLTDFESWMPDFMDGLAATLSSSSDVLTTAISTIGNLIRDQFVSAFDGANEAVDGSISQIQETVANGLNSTIEFLEGLPLQALQWGADFINGLRNGILSGAGNIVGAVQDVAENIRSYLHFSVPDKGPLKDYERWMPDFTSGLADGFAQGEETILEKVRDLANGISALAQAATARATTTAATMVSSKTSSVVQNVNIDNTYHGGSVEAQKSVSKAMKKSSDDATAYMARALAYAR